MKTYTITEEQLQSIMRLEFAARLIAAGLPPAYTQTPSGSLAELTEALGWLIFIDPNGEVPNTARTLLERTLPMLERLGDFIGNGDIDPARPGSLGTRCDLIGDIKDFIEPNKEPAS